MPIGEFAFIALGSGDYTSFRTEIADIIWLGAINESGERLTLGNKKENLTKKDYERLKDFLGEREIYINDRLGYRVWERSLIAKSALAGCPILNDSHTMAVAPTDKRLLAYYRLDPEGEEEIKGYLDTMREIILSGSYFDGENTKEIRYGRFIAHGDVSGLGYPILKGKNCLCRDLSGYYDVDERVQAVKNTRRIVSVSHRAHSMEGPLITLLDCCYLITTDGENDPSGTGLFPLLQNPYLKSLCDKHGLSYFDDWEYIVEDVFSKDIKQDVIEHYLGILKARYPERASEGDRP